MMSWMPSLTFLLWLGCLWANVDGGAGVVDVEATPRGVEWSEKRGVA